MGRDRYAVVDIPWFMGRGGYTMVDGPWQIYDGRWAVRLVGTEKDGAFSSTAVEATTMPWAQPLRDACVLALAL